MKIRRQPRKQIRFSEAMQRLGGISRTTLRDLVFRQRRLRLAPRRGDNTSPNFVYEAEVDEVAREWGLI